MINKASTQPRTKKTAQPAARQIEGRLTREGVVVSDKMQKTIVVEVTRIMRHPKFGKIIRYKDQYLVHDEKNTAKTGNKVQIGVDRPISRKKRWNLLKVL